MIEFVQLQICQRLFFSNQRTYNNTQNYQLFNDKNSKLQNQINFKVLNQDATLCQQEDNKQGVSDQQYEQKVQLFENCNRNMENIIHDPQLTQATLRPQEQIKIENTDIQIKQEDSTGSANNQCQLNQFQLNQTQNFDKFFNHFEMNFQIDEYALGQRTNQTISTLNLTSNVCKLEEKDELNSTLLKCDENSQGAKLEEQIDSDQNKNDQKSIEIQILQEIVLQKCQKYSNEYKNFKQLNRLMKDNQQINDIINEIRNPIIIHYQRLLQNQTKESKYSEKECRKDIKNYMNEQCHCMCSLNAKFTKLSSLHNHIRKQHNNTPVWCWQLKLSFQVGRPQKEIPKMDGCKKQKKSRYEKKVQRLLQMHL
ncbi:hypothetical protein ABPG72_015605 [Tetrahymena utriculariae]